MKFKLSVLISVFLIGLGLTQDHLPTKPDSKPNENEQAAASIMRTLNTAVVTYRATYKNVGNPPSLSSMAVNPENESEVSPQHASLLSKEFGCPQSGCVFHGYVFSYKRGKSDYVLSGRPQKYGEEGKISFFSDGTFVIHFTTEDRPATAKDPVVAD